MNDGSVRSLRGMAVLLAGALVAATAAACGGGHGEEGCPEYCEQLLACPAVDTTEEQCLSSCEATQEKAEEAGCSETYEKLLECEGHAEDVCDQQALENECTVQIQAHDDCVAGA